MSYLARSHLLWDRWRGNRDEELIEGLERGRPKETPAVVFCQLSSLGLLRVVAGKS